MKQIEDMIDRAAREYFPEPRTGIPAAGTYVAALLFSFVLIMPVFNLPDVRRGSFDPGMELLVRIAEFIDRRVFLLFVAAIIAMLLIRMWTVAVMFVLLQMKLAIRETPRFPSGLDDGEVIFGIGVLVMIIAGCRLVALMSPMVTSDSTFFGMFRTAYRRLAGRSNEDRDAVMPTRRGATFSFADGLTGLARAIGAVAVAAVLLAQVPLDPTNRNTVLLFEWAVRPIMIGVVLIVVFQLARGSLGILAWRRLTESEARTYLRSEFIEWPHRDVRGVVVRQVNQRRDRRRK